MRIAVVDDEELWRNKIKEIVLQIESSGVELDVYNNPLSYLECKENYDISLIDIEMKEIDGFETIRRAREKNKEGIYMILTTHTEMSRKGYLVNAFRYLDKKYIEEELEEAFLSANCLLQKDQSIVLNIVGEGTQELLLKNIYYIEAQKHGVMIHTISGTKRCNCSMAEIDNMLSGKWFYRCHNAFVVNLDEIETINGTLIYIKNGDDIDISRRRIADFKRMYLKRQYECANG